MLNNPSPRIRSLKRTGEHYLKLLAISHKYGLEEIKADVLELLKQTKKYEGFIDLVVASYIIDSEPLRKDGINRLVCSGTSPSLDQAKRLGVEVTHTLMSQARNSIMIMSLRECYCANIDTIYQLS
jgi:hypothetical protein